MADQEQQQQQAPVEQQQQNTQQEVAPAPATTENTNNNTDNSTNEQAAAPETQQQQQQQEAAAAEPAPVAAASTTEQSNTEAAPAAAEQQQQQEAAPAAAESNQSPQPTSSNRQEEPVAAAASSTSPAKKKSVSRAKSTTTSARQISEEPQHHDDGNNSTRRESPALAEQSLAERLGKMSAAERVKEGERILRERMRAKYGKGSAAFRSHTERTSLSNGPRRSEASTPQTMKARQLDEERRQAAARKFDLDERTLTSKNQSWSVADPNAIGNKKCAVPKWKRPNGARDEAQAGRRIPMKYNAPGPGSYYDPLAFLGGLK